MRGYVRIAVSVWAVVAGTAIFHAVAGAQGKSVVDGVYSDAQAKRGTVLYDEQCGSCHGADLSGIADLFPALAGEAFDKIWQGRSVGELFEKIAVTMPALEPGSLTPEQSADLTAYILSRSNYPAGDELAADAETLKEIEIVAAKH